MDVAVVNAANEGAEELAFSAEAIEGEETAEQTGFLPGSTGKQYTFIPQKATPYAQKMSDSVSETPKPPKETKSFDSKGEARTFSDSSAQPLQTKSIQVLKSEKPAPTEKQAEITHTKTDQAGRASLERPQARPPATRPPQQRVMDRRAPVQQKNAEKTTQKNHAGKTKEKKDHTKSHTQKAERHEQQAQNQVAKEHKENDDPSDEQRRREDQEEGFAEGERQNKQDEDPQDFSENGVSGVRKKGIDPKEFASYAASESKILSELLGMRVSQFDVLILFLEVMKLALKGREQERLSRMEERRLQIEHLQNMVDNFKQQGKWLLFANLGSGVLSIVSGIAPIAGHMKGNWILDKVKTIPFMGSLQDIGKDKFFKGVTKITFAMSEMQKSTGQIQNTFAESSRTFDQHMTDIHKTDGDENTRTMDELKDEWKGIENFLHQVLQMNHDAIRQLYNN
ncbi:MAG: hypothetical protein S4CHLAM2_15690 [Chlamydiales bacterium]|nr:hypothetical protein [Chlamydiales bacterium]